MIYLIIGFRIWNDLLKKFTSLCRPISDIYNNYISAKLENLLCFKQVHGNV